MSDRTWYAILLLGLAAGLVGWFLPLNRQVSPAEAGAIRGIPSEVTLNRASEPEVLEPTDEREHREREVEVEAERARIPIGPEPEVLVVAERPEPKVRLLAPGFEGCWARVREAKPALPRNQFWSTFGDGRVQIEEGCAEFLAPGIGLELEFELWCREWRARSHWRASGPVSENETITVRFPSHLAPPAERPDVVHVLENNQPVELLWASISAISGDNDQYALCFIPAGGFDQDHRNFDLSFPGHRPVPTFGHRVGETMHAGFVLARGEEEVVARGLSLPIARRGDKPYELQATFTTEQTTIKSGTEVFATISLTNVGDVPVNHVVGGWQRMATRHGRFDFTIKRDGHVVSDIGKTEHLGGHLIPDTIESGGVFEDTARLSDWAKFQSPGAYDISVAYTLQIDGTNWAYDKEPHCPALQGQYENTYTEKLRIEVLP